MGGEQISSRASAAIRVLPPNLVNRIAAGEVVERPASVVKELVENAVDSGADEIVLHIEDGGKKLIRVRDNGCGMSPGDLPLAFQSHATSKFPFSDSGDAESGGLDLFSIETLGFRGEALASIASVAELEVTSRRPDDDCAYRLRPGLHSGASDVPVPEPVAGPIGTTIEVRNLFGNTPARRKFLRGTSTELSHVVEQVLRIALGFPEIAFKLTHGKRSVLDLPRGADVRERVGAVVGDEKSKHLVEVRAERGGVAVSGFVGSPEIFRSDSRGQNFFVNGRWVRDRVLSHALKDAYQGYQIPGRQPIAYLFIYLPREDVDINVHPQKVEVRFRDTQPLHRAVRAAVREALEDGGTRPPGARAPDEPSSADSEAARAEKRKIESATRGFFDRRGGGDDSFTSRSPGFPRSGASRPFGGSAASAGRMSTGGGPSSGAPSVGVPAPQDSPLPSDAPACPSESRARPRPAGSSESPRRAQRELDLPPSAPSGRRVALQVMREFIVTESTEGLVLVDQHALHEKVLYERILKHLRDSDAPSQRLLFPEVVSLSPELVPLVPEIIERLRPFGFELEPFGPSEIAVQAVPVVLDRGPAPQLVLEVAEWIRENPAGSEESAEDVIGEVYRKIAAMMACKQAVKAGMRLDTQEIIALLEESERATDPRFCPHGRPTSIVLSRDELERRFDRR